jgi:S-adenosylmethionine hydrolase
VGPDNGLFGDVLAEVGSWRAVALDPARVALAGASFTFHGRDLFARRRPGWRPARRWNRWGRRWIRS